MPICLVKSNSTSAPPSPPEVNLSAGSDDSSQPGMPLTPTAKITVGADAFIGAGSVVTEDVPSHVFAPGNPSRIFRPR